MNRASQVTLRDIETAGIEAVIGSVVHNREAARVVAGGGIYENLLKTQVRVICRQFQEVQLNLYFKFSMLLYYFVPFISIILTLHSNFKRS